MWRKVLLLRAGKDVAMLEQSAVRGRQEFSRQGENGFLLCSKAGAGRQMEKSGQAFARR